jgi:hypothetical protein
MVELRKTAKRAQFRLWLNRWFSQLGWTLAGAGLLFVTAVLADRLWLVRQDEGRLLGWLSLGLAGAALLASVIWTIVTRENLSTAAAALDKAAGLKERLSTAMYCEKTDDLFGQAVVVDARRVSRGLQVGRHIPLRFPDSGIYTGPTLLVAVLVFLLFPVLDLAGKQQERQKTRSQQDRAERTKVELKAVVEKQVEAIRQKYPGMDPDMKNQLMALKASPPSTRPEDVRNEPMKQISNMAQKIEEKKENPDLARIDEFRKIAEKLSASQRGENSVSKLAEAMAKGDFTSAQKALEEAKLDLMKAPATDDQKQKAKEIRDQMDKLATQLQKLAENDKKAMNELAKSGLKPEEVKRALESLKKGDTDALKKELEKKGLSKQQIDKLAKELKKCQGGNQMADKLAQSLKQACQGQQGQGAQQGANQPSQMSEAGFSEAADQLSEMESLQQEMNQLSAQASDLKKMQDKMSQAGEGEGNGQGEGDGNGDGQGPDQGQISQGQGGMGNLGRGQGGTAPKTETGGKTVAQKAKVNTLPGSIISTQFVTGEQIKGDVSADFVEAVISAQREVSDAMNREQIPRQYHKSVSKYFNHSTDGLPADKVKAAENKVAQDKPVENKVESDKPSPEAK